MDSRAHLRSMLFGGMLALLPSCDQLHLTLGDEPPDDVEPAPPEDGSTDVPSVDVPAVDAAASPRDAYVADSANTSVDWRGDGSEPGVVLRAFDRGPLLSVSPPCDGGCLAISAHVSGLPPPLRVRWNDEPSTLEPTLCLSDRDEVGGPPRIFSVLEVLGADESTATASFTVLPSFCSDQPGATSTWRICYLTSVVFPDYSSCASIVSGGSVFELHPTLPPQRELEVSVSLAGNPLSLGLVSLFTSADACGEPQQRAQLQLQPLGNRTLYWAGHSEQSVRYLRVYSSDGLVTPQQVEVCERF